MSRFFNQQTYLRNLRRRSVNCSETGCPSNVVNKDCTQVKCRRHCVSSGGCRCSGHSSQRLDDAFFSEFANTPPPAIPPSDNQESRYRIHTPIVQPSSISFTLVDFHKTGHRGLVTAITSQGLWWSRPGDRRYEVFSPDFARWMEVEPTYAHDLRTRRRVLIRSPGVDGLDQDEHIAALLSEHREEDVCHPTPTSSRPRRPLPASPPTRPTRRPLPVSPPMRLIYDLARTPSPAHTLRIFGKDFHDHLDNNDPHTARPAIPQVRSLSTVADPDPNAMEMTGAPMQNLAGIADQLERLAARLRLPPTTQIPDDAIASLQCSLGAMFLATDDVSILPSKQRLAPVVKDKTARNTMMPRIKTKRTPAGDAAYGAGASSGSKASKTRSKKKKPVLPVPNLSLPPPPPPLLISAPAQTYQQAPPLSSAYPGYAIPATYYYSQYPPYHSAPYTSYQQ
ncbi:hypothetical protein R3P38DRAFT_3581695 [Favolaschia claudopus]|uniref:Uncharacterized protein n=1 Tax=Favolaschia claudopus TaxID=2862362 RepID=A0AAW0AKW3_9AGAR